MVGVTQGGSSTRRAARVVRASPGPGVRPAIRPGRPSHRRARGAAPRAPSRAVDTVNGVIRCPRTSRADQPAQRLRLAQTRSSRPRSRATRAQSASRSALFTFRTIRSCKGIAPVGTVESGCRPAPGTRMTEREPGEQQRWSSEGRAPATTGGCRSRPAQDGAVRSMPRRHHPPPARASPCGPSSVAVVLAASSILAPRTSVSAPQRVAPSLYLPPTGVLTGGRRGWGRGAGWSRRRTRSGTARRTAAAGVAGTITACPRSRRSAV